MSVGEIAALIAAIAFVLLVGALAVPLVKLGRVLDQATATVQEAASLVAGVNAQTTPLLRDLDMTVNTTNAQLAKVDSITSNVEQVTANVSAVTSLLASVMGNPVIKVAAFSYGVRSALRQRRTAGALGRAGARGSAGADGVAAARAATGALGAAGAPGPAGASAAAGASRTAGTRSPGRRR